MEQLTLHYYKLFSGEKRKTHTKVNIKDIKKICMELKEYKIASYSLINYLFDGWILTIDFTNDNTLSGYSEYLDTDTFIYAITHNIKVNKPVEWIAPTE